MIILMLILTQISTLLGLILMSTVTHSCMQNVGVILLYMLPHLYSAHIGVHSATYLYTVGVILRYIYHTNVHYLWSYVCLYYHTHTCIMLGHIDVYTITLVQCYGYNDIRSVTYLYTFGVMLMIIYHNHTCILLGCY